MTNWIDHDGGPQPVADDVWVDRLDGGFGLAGFLKWNWSKSTSYRILNQHLIDAARLEGIREGLEAAHMIVGGLLKDDTPEDHANLIMRAEAKIIFALENPETIAREATLDTLTREAQEQNMGYDHDDAKKARERERKREALRELTRLTEDLGGYEELKGDNEETAQ